MKIGIFSDLHGHNFREFSYIRDDGINSRLYHQKEVMESINEYAQSIPLNAILFGGDLTHLKNNVDSQVVKVLMDSLERMARICRVYLLPGNHDYRLWGSEPALLDVAKSLGENIIVMNEGWNRILISQEASISVWKNLYVYASPYTRKTNQLNTQIEEASVEDFEQSIFLTRICCQRSLSIPLLGTVMIR